MANDSLHTIEHFKNKTFIIPSFQRGYRWTSVEVNQLLDDLKDFFNSSKGEDYYCLQPIVVKKENDTFIVIDGQQRLTTIFLLIKFLFNESYYTINYATRKGSKDFLENIENETNKTEENYKSNIDSFYMFNAFNCIKEWFNGKELFNKDALLNKVKVIWYEIPDDECEIDVFERMNIGKIQLTEAEKIKALFLSTKVCENEDKVNENARIWHNAEIYARRNNDKLYYLFQNSMSNNDFLRVSVYLNSIVDNNENKSLYEYYYEKYKSKKLEQDWQNFKNCYILFKKIAESSNEENSRLLYHLAGFIITIKPHTAKDIWKNRNKDINSMCEELKREIINELKKYGNLEDLSYNENNNEIKNILLLYNVLLYQYDRSEAQNFPFNRYKTGKYSLEHIHAQHTSIVDDKISDEDKYNFLEYMRNFYEKENEENNQKIKEMLSKVIYQNGKSVTDDEFNNLVRCIEEDFNENMHGINNLALLDSATNSRLSNNLYPDKKRMIHESYEKYSFIPKGTRKVFDKDTEYWTANYRREYLDKIKNTLKKFGVEL